MLYIPRVVIALEQKRSGYAMQGSLYKILFYLGKLARWDFFFT